MDDVLLHGLVVRSPWPLGTSRPVPPGAVPDVVVARGADRTVPPGPPSGEPYAAVADPSTGRPFLTVVRTPDGACLRVHGVCDVELDAGASRAVVHVDPAADDGLVPVVLAGSAMTLALQLRGHLVLHASAVVRDGRAVAIVGASGMGKSTVAALCCDAGARLLADDVLRVDRPSPRAQPVAHAGAAAVRLRRGAAELASRFAGAGDRSADGRLLARPLAAVEPTAPLAAVVVPARHAGAVDAVSVRWLTGADAVLLLARFPRLLGLEDAAVAAAQFEASADLAAAVPVAIVELPPGPPFDVAVGDALLAAVLGREPTGQTPLRHADQPLAPTR